MSNKNNDKVTLLIWSPLEITDEQTTVHIISTVGPAILVDEPIKHFILFITKEGVEIKMPLGPLAPVAEQKMEALFYQVGELESGIIDYFKNLYPDHVFKLMEAEVA